jgi:hypothetical protein
MLIRLALLHTVMSLFRKAGKKFERLYSGEGDHGFVCLSCEEQTVENFEYCPNCGEGTVEPIA